MEGLMGITDSGVKIYFDDDWEEYIVKPSLDEKEWYYTDCYNDAYATAVKMERNVT
tara:strand:- start:597 stop:764 length:168 start_codon:yes stop_codon:yes gene_type:complete